MNKRYILFLVGVFLLGFIVALLLNRGQQPSPIPTPPIRLSQPTFAPIDIPQESLAPLQYILPSPRAFPETLPRYTYVTEEKPVFQYATSLGFSGTPQKLDDISGPVYLWSLDNKSLSARGTPLVLSYRINTPITKKLSPSFEKIAPSSASHFLIDTLGLGSWGYAAQKESLYYLNWSEGHPEYVSGYGQANVGELNESLSLPEGQVFSQHAGSWALLRFDADYNMLSADITVPPQPKKLAGSVSVVSYSQATERLQSGQGVLASFGAEGTNQLGYEPVSMRVSTIENVELGYYYNPDNAELMPVYRFYGTAKDTETQRPIKTYTIVSAIP